MIPITGEMVQGAQSAHSQHVAASRDAFMSGAIQKSIIIIVIALMGILVVRTLNRMYLKDRKTNERLRRKECKVSCRGGLFGFLQSREKRRCMTNCMRETR